MAGIPCVIAEIYLPGIAASRAHTSRARLLVHAFQTIKEQFIRSNMCHWLQSGEKVRLGLTFARFIRLDVCIPDGQVRLCPVADIHLVMHCIHKATGGLAFWEQNWASHLYSVWLQQVVYMPAGPGMQYMQYGPKTSVPTQQQMMSGQATAEANGYSLVLVPNMQPMGQQPMGPSPVPVQHPGTAWSQLPASALNALNQSGTAHPD